MPWCPADGAMMVSDLLSSTIEGQRSLRSQAAWPTGRDGSNFRTLQAQVRGALRIPFLQTPEKGLLVQWGCETVSLCGRGIRLLSGTSPKAQANSETGLRPEVAV